MAASDNKCLRSRSFTCYGSFSSVKRILLFLRYCIQIGGLLGSDTVLLTTYSSGLHLIAFTLFNSLLHPVLSTQVQFPFLITVPCCPLLQLWLMCTNRTMHAVKSTPGARCNLHTPFPTHKLVLLRGKCAPQTCFRPGVHSFLKDRGGWNKVDMKEQSGKIAVHTALWAKVHLYLFLNDLWGTHLIIFIYIWAVISPSMNF